MSVIQLRRSTVLADVRADQFADKYELAGEPIVRTGLSVSPTVSLVEPVSADDSIKALDQSLVTFRNDVAIDACSVSYSDECKGTNKDVDQVTKCIVETQKASGMKPTTMDMVLECAGLPVTEENKKRLADCIKLRLTKFDDVPTGTLAWCAVAIRRNLKASAMKAHSTDDYRSRLENWSRQYGVKRDQWANGTWGDVDAKTAAIGPGMDQVQPWVDRYNAFRNEFIKAGGKTSAPGIKTNAGWPWWTWALIGTGVLFVGGVILLAPTLIARRLVP